MLKLLGKSPSIWESTTICRYLASRERRLDLLPAVPRQRALVEQWMDWQATEFNNSWRYAFMGLVRKSAEHQDPHACAAGVAPIEQCAPRPDLPAVRAYRETLLTRPGFRKHGANGEP